MFDKATVLDIQDQIKITEESLLKAKDRFIEENRSEELYRLDYYFEITKKQKQYLSKLNIAIDTTDLQEIHRLITIIDTLSVMMSEDAHEIVKIREGSLVINKEDLH